MAVTPAGIIQAIRAVDTADVRTEVAELQGYSRGEINRIAPGAPDPVKDMAVIALVGYLYDAPKSAADMAYSDAILYSGAGAMLGPYRLHGDAAPAAGFLTWAGQQLAWGGLQIRWSE